MNACGVSLRRTASYWERFSPQTDEPEFTAEPTETAEEPMMRFSLCDLGVVCLQPIMLLVLPVKVRSRELAVCPRSDIRHLCGGDSGGESSNVNVLVGEGLAIPPGRNRK